jgi:hypothetical protein
MPVDLSSRPEPDNVAREPPTSGIAERMDPAMEERWAAWIARGRRHDLAVRRKLRVAAVTAAIVAAVVIATLRLFGGL